MAARDLVARLTTMSSAELRSEWLKLYKRPAPDMTIDLLRRGLAYPTPATFIHLAQAALRHNDKPLQVADATQKTRQNRCSSWQSCYLR